MRPHPDIAEGAMLGLLVGDAVGVPYEFHRPEDLPDLDRIDMIPPPGFPRSYSHIAPGTWSDDGAQALCLLDSLLQCGGWNAEHFANGLLAWMREGAFAVNGQVFDIGTQTGAALDRLSSGCPPTTSGLRGERNNGNGSLMRVLPLALVHDGDKGSLVRLAHAQSAVTHAHPRSEACCALYVLWARAEILRAPDPWNHAVHQLRAIYPPDSEHRRELETEILPPRPLSGSGYVVDCLHSAREACRADSYRRIVQTAIAFGNDTDTTACVAGGIAGIRHGRSGIPKSWIDHLRGRETCDSILRHLRTALGG